MTTGRNTIVSQELPRTRRPYSYGVRAGGWVFSAGMMGVDAEGAILGTTPGRPDVEAQTRGALEGLSIVLEGLGTSSRRVAKVGGYLSDFRYLERYDQTYCEHFEPPYPARATHGKSLPCADAMVEIDAIASVSGQPQEVRSAKLAQWKGACAQGGSLVEDVLFTTAHLSRDRQGSVVGPGDLRAQTEQALDNLGFALEAADFGFSDVIMINATVPDWFGYQAYNETFLKYFREPFEARATIQGNLQAPGMLIEFEAVAAKGQTRRFVESEVAGAGHFTVKRREDTLYLPELPPARAPHSHGVQVGRLVYLCGQIPFDSSGRLVGAGDISAQTRKTMENHRLCMEALGGNLDDIVRTRVNITDYRLLPAFDVQYASFFSPPYPARSVVVTGLPQERMLVEVEAVAVLGASQDAVALVGGGSRSSPVHRTR